MPSIGLALFQFLFFFFFFFFFPFSILADVPFNPASDDAQDVESFRLG